MSHLLFIEETLKAASAIAVQHFGGIKDTTIKTGDNNQVLTKTDLEIGKYIVDAIRSTYPHDNIIDEEAGVIDNHSTYTWVVDPIDGTANFAQGIPTYGILLGLLREGEPIVGGMALPSFGDTYSAERGKGAKRNSTSIKVTSQEKLSNSLISYGIDGHQENPTLTHEEITILEKIVLNVRNLRTTNSAYDFGLVADGRYGAYLNKTSKIWDNVAPQIIIEEAGGAYTDFYGEPLDYTRPLTKAAVNFTYCAASPILHKELQAIIHS